MIPFPKIDTLYRRDEEFKLTSELRHPIVGDIAWWLVEEKLDGTNCRLIFNLGTGNWAWEVRGRSNAAQLHPGLTDALNYTASTVVGDSDCLGAFEYFVGDKQPTEDDVVTFYGEGIGPKIQGNPYGLDEHAFVLFDVKRGRDPHFGWYSPGDVYAAAEHFGIQHAPRLFSPARDSGPMFCPDPYLWNLHEVVSSARAGFRSRLSPEAPAEGLVAKPRAPLSIYRGQRVLVKVKTTDFA